jgi:hypothetical protein
MHCWHGPSVYPFFHSSLLSGSRHEDAGCWGRSRASAVAVRWVDCARLRGPDRHVWCMYSIQSCHRHHHQEYRQHVKWWVVTAEHSTFYSDELMSYIHTYTHSYFVRFDARAWWTRCNSSILSAVLARRRGNKHATNTVLPAIYIRYSGACILHFKYSI